jgi:SHS2 domain-containing protein
MSEVVVEHLEHSGDAGLRITGPGPREVLVAAAREMVRICFPTGEIRPLVAREVRVAGSDAVELLVGWLAEINALIAIHGEVYSEFEIFALELSADRPAGGPCSLQAVVRGEPVDTERHEYATEIKAVTFHQAELRPHEGVWRGQIVFDL